MGGFYYVFNQEIVKHKDCMISMFIGSSVSALYRAVRYIFQMIYWIFISNDVCDDVNVLPYIMITGVLMAVSSTFILRDRLNLNNIHNVLYVSGYSVTFFYPLLTMDMSFNPC